MSTYLETWHCLRTSEAFACTRDSDSNLHEAGAAIVPSCGWVRVSWPDIMSECTIAASSVSTHCAIEGLKEIIHEVVGSVPDMS